MNMEMFKKRLVPSRLARKQPLPFATRTEIYKMFSQLVDQINQKLLILAENDRKIAHAAAQDIRKLTRALQQMQISWNDYVQKVSQILQTAEAHVTAQKKMIYFPAAPSARRRRISRRRTIHFPAASAPAPSPTPVTTPSEPKRAPRKPMHRSRALMF